MSDPIQSREFDAIVIGGGHNGLTSAGYLARAGLRVLLLERRDEVGGVCVEIEYFPGYRASLPNSPHSLQNVVVADLELEAHGLRFVRPDPSLVFPLSGEDAIVGWRDQERTHAELARFSRRDADSYFRFVAALEDFGSRLNLSPYEAPPSFPRVIERLLPSDEPMLHDWLFGNVREVVETLFESDEIRAFVASHAGGTSPSEPGSLMGPLLRPLTQSSSNLRGTTGLPIGGMGAITKAMRSSLIAAGGIIRTESTVEAILSNEAGVHGVVLTSGETFFAPRVISAINIKSTVAMLDDAALDGDLRRQVNAVPLEGTLFKVGLAVSEVPAWSFRKDVDPAQLAGCQYKIAPSLEVMDAALADARAGRPCQVPLMWGLTPSITDPSLAPEGKHVMSINAYHAPFHLTEGLDWSTERDRFGQRVIDTMSEYIPNLKDIITDVRYWSPQDLADEYHLVEGDIFHGMMTTRNMMSFRPAPGWGSYRTPIEGLFLGGASSWPGGAVHGLPGRNAALTVLAAAREE